VTITGDEIFAASTDVRKLGYPLDFPMNPDARFEKHALHSEVENRLLLRMRRMGLEYGAIDLRLTPKGDYVFLENQSRRPISLRRGSDRHQDLGNSCNILG